MPIGISLPIAVPLWRALRPRPRRVLATAVTALAIASLGLTSAGLSLLVGGVTGVAGEERWVILTQNGDCASPLARAHLNGRILGWPRPRSVRHLQLSSAVEPSGPTIVEPLRAGRIRENAIRWWLVLRGRTRTPLLVRLPANSVFAKVTDLNDFPVRAAH
jgi:hypothetical protein